MRTEPIPATDEGIARASERLREGDILAFPTETVYGLGADARDEAAVRRVFEAKGRPAVNPLIVHVPDLDAAARHVVVDERARRLAAAFWPGPLTLVLPLRDGHGIAPSVTAGLSTLAVRAPSHPVARRLLEAFGGPVAAPSANRSGRVSPTRPEHVRAQLDGRIPWILEAGPSEVGLESTIVDLSGPEPVLLRTGAVTAEALERVVGPVARSTGEPDRPRAPGQMLRHYAPSVPVRLDATDVRPGEAWLGFGPGPTPPGAVASANLSPSGDLAEAARNLYDLLQALDRPGVSGIAVAPVPTAGLGEALVDRLRRAAAASARPPAG